MRWPLPLLRPMRVAEPKGPVKPSSDFLRWWVVCYVCWDFGEFIMNQKMTKAYSKVTLHLDVWHRSGSSNPAVSSYEGKLSKWTLSLVNREAPWGVETANGRAVKKWMLLANQRELICSLGTESLSFLERKWKGSQCLVCPMGGKRQAQRRDMVLNIRWILHYPVGKGHWKQKDLVF